MNNNLKEHISRIAQEFESALSTTTTPESLEQVRILFLGRSGQIADCMTSLKELSVDEKRVFGPLLNELKKNTQEAFDLKEKQLAHEAVEQEAAKKKLFDVTAYINAPLHGTKHIYSQIIESLEDIFISMGYDITDGPEVEKDYYNFQALNIPADHPARDMHDTFWIDVPGMLLRTHTSPVQIRAMESKKTPLAVFAPGRCYRNEATDASHDFMFTQAEGLYIDKNVSMAHLLATAQTFLQKIFERNDLNIRVRPGYFPFVEPGVEIDVSCPFCQNGCSTCKKTKWIELLGAGLVHPNVLRSSNIDPDVYSGFAFGMGIERLAMLKHGITDIRLFHASKIDFLNQF